MHTYFLDIYTHTDVHVGWLLGTKCRYEQFADNLLHQQISYPFKSKPLKPTMFSGLRIVDG